MTSEGFAPGWYPSTERPGSQRYWDGKEWTDSWAPLAEAPPSSEPKSGVSTSKIVLGVAGGIALVVLVLAIINGVSHSNDGLDCSMRNLDHATAGEPAEDCN